VFYLTGFHSGKKTVSETHKIQYLAYE